jgi:hypothetical protein
MGLSITNYPVYKNTTTVKAYVNIRDISQDKVDGTFTLNGFAKFETNNVYIESTFIRLSSTEDFTDSWTALYTELKRLLTEKEIVFTNS